MQTQAQAFRAANSPFLFEDAHFLVEAEAALHARELEPNVFQFPDGSILVIDAQRCRADVRPLQPAV